MPSDLLHLCAITEVDLMFL